MTDYRKALNEYCRSRGLGGCRGCPLFFESGPVDGVLEIGCMGYMCDNFLDNPPEKLKKFLDEVLKDE